MERSSAWAGMELAVPATRRTLCMPLLEATMLVAAQAHHTEDAGTCFKAD